MIRIRYEVVCDYCEDKEIIHNEIVSKKQYDSFNFDLDMGAWLKSRIGDGIWADNDDFVCDDCLRKLNQKITNAKNEIKVEKAKSPTEEGVSGEQMDG